MYSKNHTGVLNKLSPTKINVSSNNTYNKALTLGTFFSVGVNELQIVALITKIT